MTTVRELISRFGVDYDDKGAKRADRSIEGLIGKMRTLGGMLAGGFVARGINNFVQQQIQLGDSIDKTSSKLGVTTQELQELRYAGELSGVAVNTLDMGMQRFTRRAAEAAQGTGEAKDTLAQMGIQLKDANGRMRSTGALLNDVADELSATEDRSERVRIAFKLFDSEGVNMINMLQGGSESLQQMRKEAAETGGVMSQELIQKSVEAADNMLRWRMTMQGLRNTLANSLLPRVTDLVDTLSSMGRGLQRVLRGTRVIDIGLQTLAATAGIAAVKIITRFAPALVTFALIAGAILAVIGVLDELDAMLTGGRSKIREWLDAWFGVEATQRALDELRLTLQEVDDLLYNSNSEWTVFNKAIDMFALGVQKARIEFLELKKAIQQFDFQFQKDLGIGSLFGTTRDDLQETVNQLAAARSAQLDDVPEFHQNVRRRRARRRRLAAEQDPGSVPSGSRAVSRPLPRSGRDVRREEQARRSSAGPRTSTMQSRHDQRSMSVAPEPNQPMMSVPPPTASMSMPRQRGGTVNQSISMSFSVRSTDPPAAGREVKAQAREALNEQLDNAYEELNRDLD